MLRPIFLVVAFLTFTTTAFADCTTDRAVEQAHNQVVRLIREGEIRPKAGAHHLAKVRIVIAEVKGVRLLRGFRGRAGGGP